MNAHRTNTSRSATDGLRAYGLTGIELHRVTERRGAEHRQDQLGATTQMPGRMSSIRQRIGDAMIRIGSSIAGEAAKSPQIAPNVRTRIDMA